MNPTLLKDLILAGHRVACRNKSGDWTVFLFINGNGRFQGTFTQENIKSCLNIGLSASLYNDKLIQENFTGEYKIVTPLPQLPQVGDTVEVLEICRELPGFYEGTDIRADMIGKKFKVSEIYGFNIKILDGSRECRFSSRMVAKCEPEKEQSIQSEEQFGDTILFNGKTYKAI